MGWIKHEGNECPVQMGTRVWLRFHYGATSESCLDSSFYDWSQGHAWSIAFYSTDEVCPDALPDVGKVEMNSNWHGDKSGMSEREFVQRYVLRYHNDYGDMRDDFGICARDARVAYRAIDEALKESQ